MIHGIGGTTLNGVTITSGTTYSVDAGNSNYLTGDLVNEGTINVGVQRQPAPTFTPIVNAGTINLSGGGTINLNNANSYLRGYNGNETLINVDNTIQGQGYIDQLGSFQNQGTVDTANVLGRDAVDLRRSYHQHRDARGHRRRHAPDLRLDRHQHGAHDLGRQYLVDHPQ